MKKILSIAAAAWMAAGLFGCNCMTSSKCCGGEEEACCAKPACPEGCTKPCCVKPAA